MGEFVHLPTCNQVLSTYDVSHMINFTRLPFPFDFSFERGESLGTRLMQTHVALSLPVCFAKNTSWCLQLWFFAKLDPQEIISGAAFCIIGLTKIPKIEFLPLDWIYRSI